jgi:hypothetical protein
MRRGGDDAGIRIAARRLAAPLRSSLGARTKEALAPALRREPGPRH